MAFKSFVNLIKWVGRFLIDGSVGLIEQSSAPGTPPLNQLTVYAKEAAGGTTQLYYKDSAGIEHDLSPGLTAILLSQVYGIRDNLKVREFNLVLTDNTRADVSTSRHGFVPKAPGNTTQFLRGDASWASPGPQTDHLVARIFQQAHRLVVRENDLVFIDSTKNDSSTSKHGLLPKLPGGTTDFLRADGSFATPTSSPDVLVVQVFS